MSVPESVPGILTYHEICHREQLLLIVSYARRLPAYRRFPGMRLSLSELTIIVD